MKKYITIVAVLIMLMGIYISISVCNTHSLASQESPFTTVYSEKDFYVVYNNKTKVMYAISDDRHNRGIFSLLVNADGSPMLYNAD